MNQRTRMKPEQRANKQNQQRNRKVRLTRTRLEAYTADDAREIHRRCSQKKETPEMNQRTRVKPEQRANKQN
jgi:hypothetical protein